MGKRCWHLAAGMLLVGLAHAEPEFLATFSNHYGVKTGALATSQCQTCHTKPPVHNAYGKEVFAEMKREGLQKLTDTVLKAIEPKDADGDGWPNAVEIQQGFLPGDATSHPAGKAPMAVAAPSGAPAPLIPEHTFHPMIVHFPIALLLFGAFLEIVGLRRKDDALRRFATWNIGFAAIASVAAVATGLIFFLRKGFAWEGLPLYHLISAVTASIFMIAATVMKRKDPLAQGMYWAVIGLAVVATSLAGFLGGTMVFG